jgi:hypothetical protein
MVAKLEEIKKAHHELMVGYVDVLSKASKFHFFAENPTAVVKIFEKILYFLFYIEERKMYAQKRIWEDEKFDKNGLFERFLICLLLPLRLYLRLFTLKFLVVHFVESHIKTQLISLRDSYICLEQTFEPDEPRSAKYREWLEKSEKALAKFADILTPWQSTRGLASALWPLVISFLVVKVSTIKLSAVHIFHFINELHPFPFVFLLFTTMLILAIYFCIFIDSAFKCKRDLFLHGLSPISLLEIPRKKEPSKNIYKLENKLFDLLEKRKNREFPVEIATFAFFISFFAIFFIIILFQQGNFIFIYILVISWLLVMIFPVIFAKKRVWR